MPPRPRSRRRTGQRRRGGSYLNIIVGVALLLLCGGLIGAYAWVRASAPDLPELDRATLCPKDGPRSVTVVLLDVSDDLPSAARAEAAGRLADVAASMPDYGLLELRLLRPRDPVTEVVFSRCNPGDGSNLRELDANPERARRRWREEFRAPLEDALSAGLLPSEANRSPIMQAIQTIALEQFTGEARRDLPKRLVVVSDMLEHGPDYSQYRGSLSYARFKDSAAHKNVWTDLNGAQVEILYVQRLDSPVDDFEHAKFWSDWVEDNRGVLDGIEKLQGAR